MNQHRNKLQQQINDQKLNNKQFFYTLTKKQRTITGSIYPKPIILIFCPQDNHLFYVKATQILPFIDQKNIYTNQIKDIVQVTRSTITNPSYSSQLIIKYPKTDPTGKQAICEWKFNMLNQKLAQQWTNKLNNYKKQKQQQKHTGMLCNITSSINGKNTHSFGVQVNPVCQEEKQNQPVRLSTYSQPISKKNTNLENANANTENNNIKPQITPLAQIQNTIAFTPSAPPNRSHHLRKFSNSSQPHHHNPPNPKLSIINLPAPSSQKPHHTNIQQPFNTNNQNEDENHQSQVYQIKSHLITQNCEQINPQNQNLHYYDWNYQFIKNPTRQTVYLFQKQALKIFYIVFNKYKGKQQSIIKQQISGMQVHIAHGFTAQSKKLKSLYRNYHYIIESCKQDPILNVPLTCLIQYIGYVCLVKAMLPQNAPTLSNKKSLQYQLSLLSHHTKISNEILYTNQSQFKDLSQIYGMYGQFSRIYIDNLLEYLPEFYYPHQNVAKQYQNSCYFVRPQLLMFLGNQLISGGNMEERDKSKQKAQINNILQNQIKDIAECLSSQDFYITNISDLKQFLHYRGINMKFLYKIYQQTKNKLVKKYLQTCIISKLIKDQIFYGLNIIIKQFKNISPQQFVQEQIKLYIEGKNSSTKQLWRKITILYQNLYGGTINTFQLVGGFLLSCLMTIIQADYDVNMLNKQKQILKDQNIIKKGFIKQLKPKIKSYYRFSSKMIQTIQICKYSESNKQIYKKLVSSMNLNNQKVSDSYNINNGKSYILGYLSDFIPPIHPTQNSLPCTLQMYNLINEQPPTAPSLKITCNCIDQNLKTIKFSKNKGDQKFQILMRDAIDIINYWLEFQHPKICQFYQKVAIYQQMRGNFDQSLNILQKILQIAYKNQGKNKKKLGIWHSLLGNQYLKIGRKKQAIKNLQKAKYNMQKLEQQQPEYTLVLLKLSSLYLNNGDTDHCIKLAKNSLLYAQQQKISDTSIIKIFQVLCRAFQIKGDKQQLRKLGAQCAKDFNSTSEPTAFSQMIKICLSGTISKLSNDRSRSLLALVNKIKDDIGLKDQAQSLTQLMQKAKKIPVIQNFMLKSQMVEKYLKIFLSNKISDQVNQYVNTLKLIAGCVGMDFIQGLHAQKEFG